MIDESIVIIDTNGNLGLRIIYLGALEPRK